jgi:hypothetical protein
MSDHDGAAPAPPPSLIVIAIDHAFIGDESDGLTQDVYDALGALDAAWPEAIAHIRVEDMQALARVGERASRLPDPALERSDPLRAAARRVRHVLERRTLRAPGHDGAASP